MNRLRTLLLALLSAALFLATFSATAGEGAHLFILSGQSNMGGLKPESHFVPEATRLFGEGGFAYIKVAKGGQPIRKWVTEFDYLAKEVGLPEKNTAVVYYKPILDQFAKMLAANPNPSSVTFCWMQGERDAKEKLDPVYEAALQKLVANLRRDLKQPKMQIVIGRLSDSGDGKNKNWNRVRAILVRVAEQDPHGAWVDCDDLNDKERNGVKRNDLHYTPEGYRILGERFARQAKRLADGDEPAKDGRPK